MKNYAIVVNFYGVRLISVFELKSSLSVLLIKMKNYDN